MSADDADYFRDQILRGWMHTHRWLTAREKKRELTEEMLLQILQLEMTGQKRDFMIRRLYQWFRTYRTYREMRELGIKEFGT